MSSTPQSFAQLVDFFLSFLNLLIPIIFAATFLYIAWGVTQGWIINGGDPKGIEKGKQIAINGVVALVFMFGIWGIIAVLHASFVPF